MLLKFERNGLRPLLECLVIFISVKRSAKIAKEILFSVKIKYQKQISLIKGQIKRDLKRTIFQIGLTS